jgi:hypothetical protein
MLASESMAELVKELLDKRTATATSIRGCSDAEIAELEYKYGVRVPDTYREFLRRLGHRAGRLVTSEFNIYYPDVMQMTAMYREYCAEAAHWPQDETRPIELPSGQLIISNRYGEQFLAIECSGQEDSPVYYFNEWQDQVKTQYFGVMEYLRAMHDVSIAKPSRD